MQHCHLLLPYTNRAYYVEYKNKKQITKFLSTICWPDGIALHQVGMHRANWMILLQGRAKGSHLPHHPWNLGSRPSRRISSITSPLGTWAHLDAMPLQHGRWMHAVMSDIRFRRSSTTLWDGAFGRPCARRSLLRALSVSDSGRHHRARLSIGPVGPNIYTNGHRQTYDGGDSQACREQRKHFLRSRDQ